MNNSVINSISVKKRNKKERQVRRAKKKKGIEMKRAKPPALIHAIEANIEDKNNNGKRRKNKRNKQGEGPPPKIQLFWTIWSPLTARMDYYIGPILKPPLTGVYAL